MLEIILQALKFVAILVGTISGAVGTLTDTRDKVTGLPTPWSRRLAFLVILSGAIAIATQGVESYLHSKAEAEDRQRRVAADLNMAKVLRDARAAATGIDVARKTQDDTLRATRQTLADLTKLQTRADQMHGDIRVQENSIKKTVTGIQSAAKSLENVTAGQNAELENLYRLAHPLGKAEIVASIWYPITDKSDRFDASWLERVRAASNGQTLVIDSGTPLDVSPESDAYRFLRTPKFSVHFSRPSMTELARTMDKPSDEESAQLAYDTLKADNSHVTVNFAEHRIEHYIHAPLAVIWKNTNIASWRDLYDAHILIVLPEGAPHDAKLVACDISFGDPRPTLVLS
ncbi:MAG TPA: hypothetical protein VFQ06_03035, partial [Nitrospira sp.]|nr:hypothetical protein [Nitrospira sp.]